MSHLKIAEERVHDQVEDNKWGKDGIEDAHKDEPSS